jgi:hypothetical protein
MTLSEKPNIQIVLAFLAASVADRLGSIDGFERTGATA